MLEVLVALVLLVIVIGGLFYILALGLDVLDVGALFTIDEPAACRLCHSRELEWLGPEEDDGDYACNECGFRSEWAEQADIRELLERYDALDEACSELDDAYDRYQKADSGTRNGGVSRGWVLSDVFDDIDDIMGALEGATGDSDVLPGFPESSERFDKSSLERLMREAFRIRGNLQSYILDRGPDASDSDESDASESVSNDWVPPQ
jgi:hypothetical protein